MSTGAEKREEEEKEGVDPREALMRNRREYADERQSERQKSMERKAMSQIMSAYGVRNKKYIIRDAQKDGHTLSWLWDKHPDSPVKLIARHIYKWSWVEMFTRFTKTPVFEAFEDAVDTYPEHYVGAVFHAGGLGDMVVHNWTAEFKGTLIVPPCPKQYGRIIVQQFKYFVQALREEWNPIGYPLEVV